MNNKKLVSLIAGILAAIMIIGLILSAVGITANAVSSSEIKEQIKELESKNEAMQAQIDDLKSQQSDNLSEIEDMVNQKSVIEQQVGLLHAQIRNVNEQIAAYAVLIADKQEELDASEKYLQELNDKHKERIRTMEEDGELSYWSVLFQANSFSDFLDRMEMIEEIQASDSRRLAELRVAAQKVVDAKNALLAEKEALQTTKEDLAAMQEELDGKSKQADELLAQLVAKGDEFAAAMEEYEHDLTELEKEIAKAETEYDEAVKREEEERKNATANQYKPGNGSASNAGYGGGTGGSTKVDSSGITWVVPCDYRKVSSAFGNRIHPVHGYWHFHSGVDLDADCLKHADGSTDSPIYATRGGVVTIARYNSSAGYYVSIDHGDGFKSTYMHMCEFPYVSVGDVVTAGQVIGCIGTTGTSTGDHLHFGLYYNDNLVNPMDYIG